MKRVLIALQDRDQADFIATKLKRLRFDPVVTHSFDGLSTALEMEPAAAGSWFAAVVDYSLPDALNGEAIDHLSERKIATIAVAKRFSDVVRSAILDRRVLDYVYLEDQRSLEYIVYILRIFAIFRGQKVLLVNDSRIQSYMIQNLLLELRLKVIPARSGEEALRICEKHPDVRIVITDYILPVMSGVDLISALRSKSRASTLMIIAMTGSASDDVSVRLLKAGANEILNKPFRKEILNIRIYKEFELQQQLEMNRKLLAKLKLT